MQNYINVQFNHLIASILKLMLLVSINLGVLRSTDGYVFVKSTTGDKCCQEHSILQSENGVELRTPLVNMKKKGFYRCAGGDRLTFQGWIDAAAKLLQGLCVEGNLYVLGGRSIITYLFISLCNIKYSFKFDMRIFCKACQYMHSSTTGQMTKCQNCEKSGTIVTCDGPTISEGSTIGGAPFANEHDNYDQWCREIGFSPPASVRTISVSNNLNDHGLVWSSDGYWTDTDINTYRNLDQITRLICKNGTK